MKNLTKPEMMQQYEAWMKCKGYAESTKKHYRSIINKFIDHSGIHPFHRTTPDIVNFISGRNSTRSKEHTKWALFWFYKFLFNQPQKVIRIPVPKRKKTTIGTYLTVNELAAVLSKINNLKHRAIIQFIYAGGLRISECLNTRLCDFDKENQLLNILNAKGNKDRVIPIPAETLNLLRTYYQKFKPSTYLFEYGKGKKYSPTSIRKILKRACTMAAIQKNIRVHDLRHSRATHLIQAGAGISFVQRFLGHSSIITTQSTYNHCDIRDLQQHITQADQKINSLIVNYKMIAA